MSGTPQVSVVMSVYNGAAQLAETLDSVLQQEGCDFEFIVINDGSTDETATILDRYAAADARLRVVHQDNTGLTRALARGCALARGEFIARQDAGDVSLPGRLRKQVQALRAESGLAFVSSATRYVGPLGEFLFLQSGTGIARSPTSIIDLANRHGVTDGPSHHGSVMFRRTAYAEAGGYRAEFYFGQDWDLWYRLSLLGMFQLLSETLYQARIDVADISVGHKAAQEQIALLSLAALKARVSGETEAAVLLAAASIRPSQTRQSRQKRIARGSYFIGECLRANGNVSSARRYLRQSIKNDPTFAKAWFRLIQALVMTDKVR